MQSQQQTPFPPSPEAPQASSPVAQLDYWGALAPVAGKLLYNGRLITIIFRTTDGDGEMALLHYVAGFPTTKEQNTAEAHYRMALAVQAVDGQEVRFPDFESKLAWVRKWPPQLLDAVLAAYEIAAFEPYKIYGEMMQDAPQPEAGPVMPGASGGQPAVSPGAD